MSPRKFSYWAPLNGLVAVGRTRNCPSETPSLVGLPRKNSSTAWPTAGCPGASESCCVLERSPHRNGTALLVSSVVNIFRPVNHGHDPGAAHVGSVAEGVN